MATRTPAFALPETRAVFHHLAVRISKHHLKSWLLVAMDPAGVLVYSGPSTFCSYWSPDHFTREFGIGPFLFSVGLESQSALERAVVSEELLRELVIDRLLLSEKKSEVTITTEVEGSAWHIEYGGDLSYHVTKQDNGLDIY